MKNNVWNKFERNIATEEMKEKFRRLDDTFRK